MDDLIRNDSEQEVYSIQDGDWEQLQMMMNGDDRRRKLMWFWRGTGFLLAMVAVLLLVNKDSEFYNGMESGIYMTQSEALVKIVAVEGVNTDRSAKSNETLPDNVSGDNKTLTDLEARVSSDLDNDTRRVASRKSIGESNQGLRSDSKRNTQLIATFEEQARDETDNDNRAEAGDKSSGALEQTADFKNENATLAIDDSNRLNTTDDTKSNLSLVQDSTLSSANTNREDVSQRENAEIGDPETVVLDSLLPRDGTLLLAGSNLDDEQAGGSEELNDSNEQVNSRKFHAYFGIGAEWSGISRMPLGPTQLKLQLGGEYLFLKKWSVLSGLNYTVKDYETNVEGYTVKPGFWINGIKPNNISAKCNVLEIPLAFRYYFTSQDSTRNSFYLTAGASSYVMASERYDFTYDVADPTLKQGWSGEWENIHYFSVLHFSAGYQKTLHRNCSILFEPYIDLPLNGIGFGQVELMSFGLSLKYKY